MRTDPGSGVVLAGLVVLALTGCDGDEVVDPSSPAERGAARSSAGTGLMPDVSRARPVQQVKERAEAWAEAFQGKDLEDAVALYADDATLLPPIPPDSEGAFDDLRFEGLGEISGFIANYFENVLDQKGDVETWEVLFLGNTAVEHGSYEADWQVPPFDVRGWYLRMWKRQGDTWVIFRETFN